MEEITYCCPARWPAQGSDPGDDSASVLLCYRGPAGAAQDGDVLTGGFLTGLTEGEWEAESVMNSYT